MSGEKGKTYADTIIQYITPRIIRVFGLPTSIDNRILSETQINIYPNPASQFVQIETSVPGNIQYHFYASNGALIREGNFEGDHQIPIKQFPNGLYVLKLISQKGAAASFWVTKE